MKTLHILLFAILGFQGCQKSASTVDLSNIALLRGDLALCGDSNFGTVSFSLNCAVDVRTTFNLALSLLHSFEYDEAEKMFVRVIDVDPECAMAYWGVAMSNFHSLWQQAGTDYLAKGSEILAASRQIKTSEKEQDYLDAINSFYTNWESESRGSRIAYFEESMRHLHEKYPEDIEAAIFYALSMTADADPTDKTYSKQRESGKLLESIFRDHPNHPGIAHYIIHNYDYPELAELALPTARKYADIAPASAHAQHMPSHIFTRLGLWNESIQSNLKSVQSAVCYADNIDSSGHWDEEFHGMDYLVYAYLQLGDNAKAREQLEYLNTITNVFPPNFKIAYATAAIPARIALENRDWNAATSLEMPAVEIDWTKFPWQRSILHFARALGAANLGDLQKAEAELAILESNRQELLDKNATYEANQVMIQIQTIKAWLAFAKGENNTSVELMRDAAKMEYGTSKHPVTPGEVLPAGELLGDMLLKLNNPSEALAAYEFDLTQHPNRFNGLYGAAIAAKGSGDMQKAKTYFQKLLDQAPGSDRKEIQEARSYLRQ